MDVAVSEEVVSSSGMLSVVKNILAIFTKASLNSSGATISICNSISADCHYNYKIPGNFGS